MPVRIDVNEAGIERIRQAKDIRILEGDRRGPLRIELQKTHVKQVNLAFKTKGGSVAGGPWPAWSPSYAAWRNKNPGFGRTMMVLNKPWKGRRPKQLRTIFTRPTSPAFVSKFLKPWTYQFGGIDDVAAKHQAGVGRLPIRSVIDKTPKQLKEFQETIRQFWNKFVDQHLRNL